MASKAMADQVDNMNTLTFAEVKKRFDAMDTDNNGTISYDEMYAAIKKKGITIDDNYVKSVWQEMDSDNNGKIDFAEYCAVWGRVFTDSNQT